MRGQIADDSIVLIHDGVRPLIDEELITNNIRMAEKKRNRDYSSTSNRDGNVGK